VKITYLYEKTRKKCKGVVKNDPKSPIYNEQKELGELGPTRKNGRIG
jgi:hypothetical protein